MPRAGEEECVNPGMMAKACGVSFWNDENVLKLIVMITALLCEYIKSYRLVHLKG